MMLRDFLKYINRGRAIKISLLLLSLLITEIVLTCYIPLWKSMLFEPIKDKDISLFYHGLIIFGTGLTTLGLIQGVKVYVSTLFSLELRETTSKALYHTWVNADEPQTTGFLQPQTDAIRMVTTSMVDIFIEVFISFFIVIGLIIANLGHHIVLIGAITYSILISIITVIFNKPMTSRNVAMQESDGLYNEKLADIAGKKDDFPLSHFIEICVSYIRFQLMNMFFTLTSSFTGILSHLVPYVLLAGAYFDGKIDFGEYMAGIATFELIVVNATILTIKYPLIIKALASWKIIKNFHKNHIKF